MDILFNVLLELCMGLIVFHCNIKHISYVICYFLSLNSELKEEAIIIQSRKLMIGIK